jgi:hypothetical protein
MSQVTVKIPRNTYLAIKAMAKRRGCFIGKVISDAITLFNSVNPDKPKTNPESKEQAA